MPGIKSHKLGWDGVPKITLFDPEPGFRWVRYQVRYAGRADLVVSSVRVAEGATEAEAREQVIRGCGFKAADLELKFLSEFKKCLNH